MNTSIDAVIIKLQNFCSFYNLRIILILRLVLRLAPVTGVGAGYAQFFGLRSQRQHRGVIARSEATWQSQHGSLIKTGIVLISQNLQKCYK